MVPNAGEPGGGPFWTLMADGGSSIQIVEQAQINTQDPSQSAVMATATHFNPVDLVCSTKTRDGTRYALSKFVDHSAGFISSKSLNGREKESLDRAGNLRKTTNRLSPREVEVLQLIAEGKPNKQVAAELGVSFKTADKHRQHLMGKLDIHDVAGLTRYAIAQGIIESQPRVIVP